MSAPSCSTTSSVPYLPTEILGMIVGYCDVSSYLALTRVNTAVRQFVYENLEPILTDKRHFYNSGKMYYSDEEPPEFPEISHDLAIHLLNNQAPNRREPEVAFDTRDHAATHSRKMYAPFFTIVDYNDDLAQDMFGYSRLILAGMETWLSMLGSSGNHGIDAIRMMRELERRLKRKRENVLASKRRPA